MVKARNNPQGERVLVNELVGGLCLDWLTVLHPRPAIINIPEDVVQDNPAARFNNGTPLATGLAFGSELWQSDGEGIVDVNLTVNRHDVAGILAFDTWVQQFDARQYRMKASSENPRRYDFFPVDQGFSFGAPQWDAAALSTHTVTVPTPAVAIDKRHLDGPIRRLMEFSRDEAAAIVGQVPDEWLSGPDREALADYLEKRAILAANALRNSYPE